MASKIKVDQIQTADGTGTIALQNQLSGMTSTSMPTGSVLQVVQGTVLSTQTLTTSATYVDAGISASITPTSANSKILVTATLGGAMCINNSSNSAKAYLRIAKGSSTEVCVSRIATYDYGGSGTYIAVPAYLSRLDSPSTTSEITYKIQFMLVAGNDVRICFNDSDSQLILTEIAG